jgi:TfoX/Sxy family transcriptional regulator of competence genes
MNMDDKLLENVRKALADAKPLREVKMFGGIGFMLGGNMLAGVSDRGLLVRVGKDADEEALSRPGAEPMIMRGRKMAGYIRVRDELDARSVKSWVKLARAHVESLPAKKPKKKAAKKKKAARA